MEKNHIQLWEECSQYIKDNIDPKQYDIWFRDIVSMSFDGEKLRIIVPSSYYVDQLEDRFMPIIASAIRKVYGENVQLYYHYNQVQDAPETSVNLRSSNPSPAIIATRNDQPANPFQAQALAPIDPQLNPRYTFENYCLGDSNRIARSIAESIADNPQSRTFNPLFVFGSTGVGKTHLIQAIGIRIKEHNPEARVLYVTARLFESQFTAAHLKGDMNKFFHFYHSIDTLIVDDIQDLNGKSATQNTFFHIFNQLHLNNRRIILSSDCAPSEMDGFEARLLSRFKWGMSVHLDKPDYNLRRDVLIQKAEQDGLEIPEEVIDLIASSVTESIRDLEGIMVSLVAHAAILNSEITLDLARTVVGNAVKINKRPVNFEIITQEVSNYYGIEADLLFTASRKREISDARQMVMYMAKKMAKMPLKAIGARIARTHATVIYACRNIEERLGFEKQLQADVSAIEAAINRAVNSSARS